MEITVRHAPSFAVGRCALAGQEILRVESRPLPGSWTSAYCSLT